MAEQWVKYLQKQTQYMRKRIESVLVLLKNWQTQWVDIKELKWYKWIYRVRIWDIRLIYRIKLWSIEIVSLWSRGDIYKDFTL